MRMILQNIFIPAGSFLTFFFAKPKHASTKTLTTHMKNGNSKICIFEKWTSFFCYSMRKSNQGNTTTTLFKTAQKIMQRSFENWNMADSFCMNFEKAQKHL